MLSYSYCLMSSVTTWHRKVWKSARGLHFCVSGVKSRLGRQHPKAVAVGLPANIELGRRSTAAIWVMAATFLLVSPPGFTASPSADVAELVASEYTGISPVPPLAFGSGAMVSSGDCSRWAVGIFSSQAGAASLQAPTAASLYRIIEQAKSSNPEIARAMAQIRKAKADLSAAESVYSPSVRVSTNGNSQGQHIGGTFGANVQVTKLLHDFGKSDNLISEARLLEQAKIQEQIDTVNRVVLEITENYLNLLRQVALQGIHREAEIALQESIRIIGLRIESGLNAAGDGYLAQARLDQIRAARVSASAQQEQFLSRLVTLSGMSLQDVSQSIPVALAGKGPEGPWNAADTASVRQAEAEYQAAVHRARSVQASHWPSVYLQGGRNMGNASGFAGAANFVSVTMSVDVLDAGSPFKIESAKADADAALLKTQSARQAVEDATRRTQSELKGIEARQPIMAAQSRSTAATQQNFMEQFLAGRRQILDLLNTQQEVLAIEAALAGLKFDRMLQISRLYSLHGSLFDLLSKRNEGDVGNAACTPGPMVSAGLPATASFSALSEVK